MAVKVDVKLDVKSMSDFMIHQIYTSLAGIVSLLLGALNVGLVFAFIRKGDYLLVVVFVIFALLLLVGFPRYIRYRVSKMSNTKRMTETVTYEFSEEGIVTTTSTDSGKASWSKFKKAVSKKRIIMLYDYNRQAIILPVDELGEQYTEVVDLIFAHMPVPAVRIRRLDRDKKGQKVPVNPGSAAKDRQQGDEELQDEGNKD